MSEHNFTRKTSKHNFIDLKRKGRVSVEDKYGDIVFNACDEWTRDKILEAIENIQELKEWFKDRKGCIAFGCEADSQFLEAYLCDEKESNF
ncbi:TPA: hypothetical protein VGT17_005229 [Vibrio harveyi]|nr:hypothetical protein [Vibrio harveyi]HEQ3599227.1 hypothetical protein [Vibrio harveyi]HEQ3611319.1 hypothetical protein [Vibrio harveyi]